MMTKKFIIAVDGPAASGKGTISKRIANKYSFYYLDTGLLYRAVAFDLVKNQIDIDNIYSCHLAVKKINLELLEYSNPKLREENIGKITSKIASIKVIREILLDHQRGFYKNLGQDWNGIVMDGRDIGTVVMPTADLKFFITANTEVRAFRRNNQLNQNDNGSTYANVLKDLVERDKRDINRDSSPLLPAEDAIVIDTSDMNVDEVFNLVNEKIKIQFNYK